MRHFAPALFLVCSFITAGCATEPETTVAEQEARALIGTWSADDTTRFVFREDGDALWIFGEGAAEDTFRIRYDYSAVEEPAHLNLTGFDRGFLRDRTLYCIIAFDSVSAFRMDCEPGDAVATDARPDSFSQKTMTYRSDQEG